MDEEYFAVQKRMNNGLEGKFGAKRGDFVVLEGFEIGVVEDGCGGGVSRNSQYNVVGFVVSHNNKKVTLSHEDPLNKPQLNKIRGIFGLTAGNRSYRLGAFDRYEVYPIF